MFIVIQVEKLCRDMLFYSEHA